MHEKHWKKLLHDLNSNSHIFRVYRNRILLFDSGIDLFIQTNTGIMTAKERAEHLIKRLRTETSMMLMTIMAKPFALITVDEIIKALPEPDSSYQDFQIKEENIDYWNEVKKEIEQL